MINKKFRIYDFDEDFKTISKDINSLTNLTKETQSNIKDFDNELNSIKELMYNLSKDMGIKENLEYLNYKNQLYDVDTLVNELLFDKLYIKIDNTTFKETNKSAKKFPKLTAIDYTVCVISGIIGSLVDIFIVGIPKIKKFNGSEQLTGAPLTEIIRKIGKSNDNKDLSPALKWLEEKCKVPYDLSIIKGEGVYPGNHRLKSLSHDPLIGLVFAIIDIKFETVTYINNEGLLCMKKNTNSNSINEWLAVLYYLGHIISDICTARGISIPGWCLTQFFVIGELGADNKNIAKIADKMYRDGYDLRHLGSMATSTLIVNSIIHLYYWISNKKDFEKEQTLLYEKESNEITNNLKKHKMLFVANSTATLGNLIKFIAPPSLGDPKALNFAQWFMFIKESTIMIQASLRNMRDENIINNRKEINKNWEYLFNEI